MTTTTNDGSEEAFRNVFREHYSRIERAVFLALTNSFGDPVLIGRTGDDVDQFLEAFRRYQHLFPEEEQGTIRRNVARLQGEIQQGHRDAIEGSHHGNPHPVDMVRSGGRGRPRLVINREWLTWAINIRCTSHIASFLNVSRPVVRAALLQYGLRERGEYPFMLIPTNPNEISAINPRPITYIPIRQSNSGTTEWSDEQIDEAVTQIRVHFHNAGITIIEGALRAFGERVPRERIRQSLIRIDPIRRLFARSLIDRRQYNVPGPNFLWHHDGQHGLIRWGIVIHGFIDGYSRLITGIRASNNNRASTVLDVFFGAIRRYGIPSRVRGDHGTENLQVAAFMEFHRGQGRGSYIWGRSVHNVRIERLWVDVTTQVGAKWADFFTSLELHHGLNASNRNHRWLLQYLFLLDINDELQLFVDTWNNHRIQMRRGQRSRSPIDMFGFDMLAHGIRGDIPEEFLSDAEMEHYGVDWAALRRPAIEQSYWTNNDGVTDGRASWSGRRGPPPASDLNEVEVEPPVADLSSADVDRLFQAINPLFSRVDEPSLIERWEQALSFMRSLNNGF